MTTEAAARAARLGETARQRAREVADEAPDLTPAQQNALAVLMRDTRTTKATTEAA